MEQQGLRLNVKRLLDLAGAGAAFLATAPVMAAAALAIRATMGRPVLFRQPRPGYKGRIFTAYKFRTMREAEGPDGTPLPDADRLTPVGRLVRRASIDELPQVWNVLRGDLSLVGPRPLLVRYLPRYSPEQMRRHDVLPGITGWAQVNGRNATTWDERFAHDLFYVDNWSLGLDLRIILMTAWKVLHGSGVSQSGHATMPEFMGNRDGRALAAEG
jgi:lipopolysaccharide/colanic/teichoic acid biosynthesis glycosyltransferase